MKQPNKRTALKRAELALDEFDSAVAELRRATKQFPALDEDDRVALFRRLDYLDRVLADVWVDWRESMPADFGGTPQAEGGPCACEACRDEGEFPKIIDLPE